MGFQAGQRIVCVDDNGQTPYLTSGTIYTVELYAINAAGIPGVVLVEVNPPWDAPQVVKYHKGGFKASRFRPLIERKTDISVFIKLLDPHTHRHLEGA